MNDASEGAIERQLVAKNKTAPRLTPIDIDETIKEVLYHVFPGTTLTVCALILKNGFVVTGTSAAASLENFDEEIGRQIAHTNARSRIWELEGYRLRQRLYETEALKAMLKGMPIGSVVDFQPEDAVG